MQNRIPTSDQLADMAIAEVSEVPHSEREQWAQHECTRCFMILLEAFRMRALEVLENCPEEPERRAQMAAQAAMAHNLYDDMMKTIFNKEEEDENDDERNVDKTKGSPRNRPAYYSQKRK